MRPDVCIGNNSSIFFYLLFSLIQWPAKMMIAKTKERNSGVLKICLSKPTLRKPCLRKKSLECYKWLTK